MADLDQLLTSSLSSKKKAQILILLIDNDEHELAFDIIKSLKPELAKHLLDVFKKRLFFTESEVNMVANECYDILIDQKELFAGAQFIRKLEKNIQPKQIEVKAKILENPLRFLPIEFVKDLCQNESYFAIALLCKMSTQEDIIHLIESLDDKVAQKILEYYVNTKPTSTYLLEQFNTFISDINQDDELFDQLNTADKLARIIEQTDSTLQKSLLKQLNDPKVKESIFKLDDLNRYSLEELNLIFSQFNDPKKQAVILTGLNESIITQLKSSLSKRRVQMIESELPRVSKINKEDRHFIIKEFISMIRHLQDQGDLA